MTGTLLDNLDVTSSQSLCEFVSHMQHKGFKGDDRTFSYVFRPITVNWYYFLNYLIRGNAHIMYDSLTSTETSSSMNDLELNTDTSNSANSDTQDLELNKSHEIYFLKISRPDNFDENYDRDDSLKPFTTYNVESEYITCSMYKREFDYICDLEDRIRQVDLNSTENKYDYYLYLEKGQNFVLCGSSLLQYPLNSCNSFRSLQYDIKEYNHKKDLNYLEHMKILSYVTDAINNPEIFKIVSTWLKSGCSILLKIVTYADSDITGPVIENKLKFKKSEGSIYSRSLVCEEFTLQYDQEETKRYQLSALNEICYASTFIKLDIRDFGHSDTVKSLALRHGIELNRLIQSTILRMKRKDLTAADQFCYSTMIKKVKMSDFHIKELAYEFVNSKFNNGTSCDVIQLEDFEKQKPEFYKDCSKIYIDHKIQEIMQGPKLRDKN